MGESIARRADMRIKSDPLIRHFAGLSLPDSCLDSAIPSNSCEDCENRLRESSYPQVRNGLIESLALVIARWTRNIPCMRNTISLIIGGLALLLAIIAFLPLLGWANWVIIPMAVVGLAFGAMSDKTSGRNLNIVVIAVGVLRLWLGGGIL